MRLGKFSVSKAFGQPHNPFSFRDSGDKDHDFGFSGRSFGFDSRRFGRGGRDRHEPDFSRRDHDDHHQHHYHSPVHKILTLLTKGFGFYNNPGKGHGYGHDHHDKGDDFEYREIDGSNNNRTHPDYGTTGSTFMSISGYDYGDGISTPNDSDRPNVRDVSNVLFAQSGDIYNHSGMSNFLWIWGQFLDHDINLTREGHSESYDIDVPMGDAYFDPYYTGSQTISFTRSDYAEGTGTDEDNPRLQVNEITAFIDASNVYGSTAEVEAALRGDGGKLKMSAGDLLPMTAGEHGMDFQAGDVRASENVALTSMHTLFVREHNHWVEKLAQQYPHYSDDELYQKAKAIVEAEIQHITYDEFLPALLGEDAIGRYRGYNPDIDPQIATEFATAAFRVGHTMLSSNIFRYQENGDESDYGHLTLQNAFFRPDIVMTQGGIDEILRGAGSGYAQHIDYSIIDDVRNFLFGPPGAGGFDLVSLNIQRGRDHGLPDFNSVREAYGLDPVDNFMDLTGNAQLAEKLSALYGDISNLDLWVGGLVETAFHDALVGETFYTIIVDQFTRLRDGDRFWYEDRLDDAVLNTIQDTSLADIIIRNTDIDHLQDDVFSMKNRIGGDDLDNVLYGTDSADLLIGFDGDDVLRSGDGEDVLYGGDGEDIFVLDHRSEDIDVIRDFVVGEDYIAIEDILDYDSPHARSIEKFIFATRVEDGTEIGIIDGPSCSANNGRHVLALLEGVFENDADDLLLPGGSNFA